MPSDVSDKRFDPGAAAPAQRRDPDEEVTFDDALMRIGIGRGQYFSIATMCLLWMGEGMQMFICFYLPKAFYDEWGTPVDDVAWVDGSMFAGVFFGALVGGHCGDAYGRRPTLLFFTGISVVTGILCWFTTSFMFLVTIRFLVGFGAGGFAPSSLSTTLEVGILACYFVVLFVFGIPKFGKTRYVLQHTLQHRRARRRTAAASPWAYLASLVRRAESQQRSWQRPSTIPCTTRIIRAWAGGAPCSCAVSLFCSRSFLGCTACPSRRAGFLSRGGTRRPAMRYTSWRSKTALRLNSRAAQDLFRNQTKTQQCRGCALDVSLFYQRLFCARCRTCASQWPTTACFLRCPSTSTTTALCTTGLSSKRI